MVPRLPDKDFTRHYPATMTDAVAIVHQRAEEARRRAQSGKNKSKGRGGGGGEGSSHFPGAREGGGDPSAFWMYIEVGGWVCGWAGG